MPLTSAELSRRTNFYIGFFVVTSATLMLELIQTRILSVPFWLPQVFATFNSAKLFTRALLCVATVAPAGLLMGFGFPSDIRLVSLVDRNPTPWFFSLIFIAKFR